MAGGNVLEKDKPELIDIERKDGLLEELDLPPKLIKAIRENATALQLAAVTIVILIFAWTYYDYYTANKKNEASASLHLAVQEVEPDKQLDLYRQVATDFPGTEAALWSEMEQGHRAFEKGDYPAALSKYKAVESDLAGDSPLRPLLFSSLGLAYENNNELEQAMIYYRKLDSFKGFRLNGLLASGRVLELQGKTDEALQKYSEASLEKELPPASKSILTEKMNNLKAPVSKE
ncbi:MAG: tetratricopeptide repeat protein [Proteobacteria bacterium]|nr:tetratricopeptide repeat protein [Pseudomonadota bacterium]MBU1738747.1 tetratricopeptide repeat protein [Pseudomonadota bacterium]